jgi:hypothetical protein
VGLCPPTRSEYEAPTGERPKAVRVWLLGGFRVSVGSRIIEDKRWRLKKAATLVKLLALARSGPSTGGTDPTSCSSRGWAIPPKRGSHSSTASRTVTASPPSTTVVRGALRFPRGASRRPRWPTMPPRCYTLWRSRAPTLQATPWAAPSRRSWPFGTPSSSAASSS